MTPKIAVFVLAILGDLVGEIRISDFSQQALVRVPDRVWHY
jgi:hypothetical protein